MSTAFSAISSFSYSAIRNRISFASVFALGYLLMAISYFLIGSAHSLSVVLLAMVFAGLGIGIMIPNSNMWVMKIAPVEIRGKEIGKLTTFWFLGQFISPVVMAPILLYLSISELFQFSAIILALIAVLFFVLHFRKQDY